MLWDRTCRGDKALALENFFNNSGTISEIIYGPHCIWSLDPQCQSWLLPQSERVELLDWLRKPECVQSFNEYHHQHPEDSPWTWKGRVFTGWGTYTQDWKAIATTTKGVGCCNQCVIQGGNVDVYYWPASDSNTACLSAVGSSFNNPLAGLLTTDTRGYQYWKAPSNPYGGTISSESLGIPPPMALGGPEDPFYNDADPGVQSYLSQHFPPSVVSQLAYRHAHHPNAKLSRKYEQNDLLSLKSRHSLSDRSNPSPGSRISLLSSSQSTADLQRRTLSHPITSAIKPQDLSVEATIGDFTW